MASKSPSLCISCRLRLLQLSQRRAFCTSTPRQAIPPESPNYIDIPPSFQPDLIPTKRPKGKLPVPRELFPRQRPDKPSEQYIRSATPDKLPKNQPGTLTTVPEHKRHKLRMSSVRKSHLRTSLVDLHARETSMKSRIARASLAKQTERARLLAQPLLPSDSLTAISIPSSLQPSRTPKILAHPDPAALLARKRSNIAANDLFGPRKHAGRQSALHDLYMNARSFITNEAQLMAALDREFPEDGANVRWATSQRQGNSIWNLGPPTSVSRMLADVGSGAKEGGLGSGAGVGFGRLGMDRVSAAHRRDQERMRRIAEELSGGKM